MCEREATGLGASAFRGGVVLIADWVLLGEMGRAEVRSVGVLVSSDLSHRRVVNSAFAVVARFGRCTCWIAVLLGHVSKERITESEVQRLERRTQRDRFEEE